jgi:hypothetical protein
MSLLPTFPCHALTSALLFECTQGATVSASDISAAMAGEASERYQATAAKSDKLPTVSPTFEAMDLE